MQASQGPHTVEYVDNHNHWCIKAAGGDYIAANLLKPDAVLFAAAPALKDALENLVEWHKHPNSKADLPILLQGAREALAMTEGENQ